MDHKESKNPKLSKSTKSMTKDKDKPIEMLSTSYSLQPTTDSSKSNHDSINDQSKEEPSFKLPDPLNSLLGKLTNFLKPKSTESDKVNRPIKKSSYEPFEMKSESETTSIDECKNSLIPKYIDEPISDLRIHKFKWTTVRSILKPKSPTNPVTDQKSPPSTPASPPPTPPPPTPPPPPPPPTTTTTTIPTTITPTPTSTTETATIKDVKSEKLAEPSGHKSVDTKSRSNLTAMLLAEINERLLTRSKQNKARSYKRSKTISARSRVRGKVHFRTRSRSTRYRSKPNRNYHHHCHCQSRRTSSSSDDSITLMQV